MPSPSAVDRVESSVAPGRQHASLDLGTRRSRSFASAAYLALLLFFVVVVFWKVALTRQYTLMAWSDSAEQTYPWSQFMAATLHRHSFPFWDPFTDGGRPFLGEAQTAVYYPLNLVMAALPLNRDGLLPTSYINFFVLLHCFLASVFTYFLGRRLGLSPFASFIAAVAYTYSGSVARRSFAQINLFYGTVWIPAVFLCYFSALAAPRRSRRWALASLGGLCLALSFLAGHHQPPLYCAIALAATAIMLWFGSHRGQTHQAMNFPRRVTASVTLIVLLSAGLYSAPQLISSFEYSSRALRWVDVGENQQPVAGNAVIPYSIATKWVLHPRDLVLLLFPNYTPVDNPPYLGILPLFFLLLSIALLPVSRVVRGCWLILMLFLSLALGPYSPLHGLFYVLVPFYNATRLAQRNLVMAHVAGALLAGLGCNALLERLNTGSARDHSEGSWLPPVGWLQAVSLAAIAVVSCMYVWQKQLPDANAYDGLFFACFLLAASSSLLWLRGRKLLGERAFLAGLVIILLFDSHAFLSPYIQPKSGFNRSTNLEPDRYYAEDDLLRFLRLHLDSARVAFHDPYYPTPVGDVYRFETLSGTEATRLKSMFDLGTGEATERLLGVKYIVSDQQLPLPVAFAQGKNKVYENPKVLPRAWLVSRIIAGHPSDAIAQKLRQPDFEPRKEALLTKTAGQLGPDLSRLAETGSMSSSAAGFQWLSPNHFRVTTGSQQPAFLVISEASYPGWTAALKGKRQSIFQTDGALMGLFVPAGNNVVDFVFRPTHLFLALALVVGAVTFLLGSLLLSYCCVGHSATRRGADSFTAVEATTATAPSVLTIQDS